jgi:hypothetical protein
MRKTRPVPTFDTSFPSLYASRMSYQIHEELSHGVLILLCTACAQRETVDGLDPSHEGGHGVSKVTTPHQKNRANER